MKVNQTYSIQFLWWISLLPVQTFYWLEVAFGSSSNSITSCSTSCNDYLKIQKHQNVFQMTIYSTEAFLNATLNMSTEKENLLKSRNKCFECQITFHTVDYSPSREDKGRLIVLKIQGRWGEIAFRVRVHSGMRAVGCWANWIHVWNLHS